MATFDPEDFASGATGLDFPVIPNRRYQVEKPRTSSWTNAGLPGPPPIRPSVVRSRSKWFAKFYRLRISLP
jgi:hypothetical protein